MSRLIIPSFTVIRDTREKPGFGWTFDKQKETTRPPKCNGMIIDTLETGDYTLVGYEDLVTIERKDDFGELWTNYKNRNTFEDEIKRMESFKYKFIIIESPITRDHFDLTPPQFTTSVPGRALISWLTGLQLKYNVHIMCVSGCGSKYAMCIFKEVIRLEKDRWIRQ